MDSQALELSKSQPLCVICNDELPWAELERLDCDHSVCYKCLIPMFEHSLTAVGKFPTRCCGPPVRFTARVLQTLPADLIIRYNDKKEEVEADDFPEKRTYCHVPQCSTFIKRRFYSANRAVCPKCAAWTCIACKKEFHDKGVCTQRGELRVPEIELLAEAKGWIRCRSCRHMIQRAAGTADIREWSSVSPSADSVVCADNPDRMHMRHGIMLHLWSTSETLRVSVQARRRKQTSEKSAYCRKCGMTICRPYFQNMP